MEGTLLRFEQERKLKELLAQNEEIVRVSSSGHEAKVVTRVVDQQEISVRFRYDSSATGDEWLIQCVNLECPSCNGERVNDECPICGGNGWFPFPTDKQGASSALRPNIDSRLPTFGDFDRT